MPLNTDGLVAGTWSVDDIARLRKMARDGYTMRDAATELGRTWQSVRGKAAALGLEITRERASYERAGTTTLTRHQKRIAIAVACGLTNEEIGIELGKSAKCVTDQLVVIMNKTGANNRTRVAVWALREGLLTIDEAWEADPADVSSKPAPVRRVATRAKTSAAVKERQAVVERAPTRKYAGATVHEGEKRYPQFGARGRRRGLARAVAWSGYNRE